MGRFGLKTIIALLVIIGGSSAVMADRPAAQDQFTVINGMRVYARHDSSVPLVGVIVMIRAGSAYERPEESGLSHLLEHLVFDGTTTRTREELKDAFDKLGGYVNAYTRDDYVAVEILMPKQFLKQGLELQADMLFNSTISEQELAKEKKVVVEELQGDKADPSYAASEEFQRMLYAGTPYERPVLGTESTVNPATRAQILNFYRRHYVPANMTMIAVGEVTKGELLKAAYPLYSGRLSGSSTKPTAAVSKAAKPRAQFAHLDVPTSFLYVDFPIGKTSISAYQELIATMLSMDGSPLQNRLINTDKPLASDLSASIVRHPATSSLQISAMLSTPDSGQQVLTEVLSELKRLAVVGPGKGELTRAKLSFESGEVFGSERPLYFARELVDWQSSAGLSARNALLRQIQSANSEGVRKAASDLLKSSYFAALFGRTGALQLPGNVPLPAAVRDPSIPPAPEAVNTRDLAPGRTITQVLPNGLTVIARENPFADITAVNVLVKDRAFLEPTGLEGIGDLTARLLDDGTQNRSSEAISDILSSISARLQLTDDPYFSFDDYYFSKNYSYVRLETLGGYYRTGISILADVLHNSTFPQPRVETTKQEMLAQLASRKESAGSTARKRFFETMFPSAPYHTPILGDEESIKRITRQNIIDFYQKAYAPNNLIIAVVGDQKAESLIAEMERQMGTWKPKSMQTTRQPLTTSSGRVVSNLKSPQTVIYLGYPLSADQLPSTPAIEALSELLSNRLTSSVREKLGYAYSIGVDYELTQHGGWFYVAFGARPENVEKAETAVLDEMGKLQTVPVTKEELSMNVNSLIGRRFRYRQSRINQAHFLALYEYLSPNDKNGWRTDKNMPDLLQSLTPSEVQEAAWKTFVKSKLTLSIAGELQPDSTTGN